eukprot:261110-Prymnesium_polylepis.2
MPTLPQWKPKRKEPKPQRSRKVNVDDLPGCAPPPTDSAAQKAPQKAPPPADRSARAVHGAG